MQWLDYFDKLDLDTAADSSERWTHRLQFSFMSYSQVLYVNPIRIQSEQSQLVVISYLC